MKIFVDEKVSVIFFKITIIHHLLWQIWEWKYVLFMVYISAFESLGIINPVLIETAIDYHLSLFHMSVPQGILLVSALIVLASTSFCIVIVTVECILKGWNFNMTCTSVLLVWKCSHTSCNSSLLSIISTCYCHKEFTWINLHIFNVSLFKSMVWEMMISHKRQILNEEQA